MRHSQPEALTLLVSGYPDVRSAMAAILLEADEIMVKPFDIGKLADLVRQKMLNRRSAAMAEKERVGTILRRCIAKIVEDWLSALSMPTATAKDSDAVFSVAAVAHGRLRYKQGYTPAMLVHESRILQVTLFGTLQSNLSFLDFSVLLPDVMTIADEVDTQLMQSMDS